GRGGGRHVRDERDVDAGARRRWPGATNVRPRATWGADKGYDTKEFVAMHLVRVRGPNGGMTSGARRRVAGLQPPPPLPDYWPAGTQRRAAWFTGFVLFGSILRTRPSRHAQNTSGAPVHSVVIRSTSMNLPQAPGHPLDCAPVCR